MQFEVIIIIYILSFMILNVKTLKKSARYYCEFGSLLDTIVSLVVVKTQSG